MAVQTDAATGVPTFLVGRLSAASSDAPAAAAARFLADNAAVFGLGAGGDVIARSVERDALGLTHVRVQQTASGVPVFGGDAVVHLDRTGAVYAFSGHLRAEASDVEAAPAVSADAALAAARADVRQEIGAFTERAANDLADWTPDAHLVVYPVGDALRLAYHARLYTETPMPGNWEVFVDAQTGRVIERWNSIHTVGATGPEAPAVPSMMWVTPATGSGNSLYSGTVSIQTDYTGSTYRLYDTTRGSGGIRTRTANNGTSLPGSDITSATNSFTATAARAGVDAHWGAEQVYDYYLGTHGRNSYNNAGAALNSTVHYSSSYNNAYWDGTQMVYGDGNGSTFSPLYSGAQLLTGGVPMTLVPTAAPSDALRGIGDGRIVAKTAETLLLPSRPNPTRGATTVAFSLAEAGVARVSVIDVLGREVAVLVDGSVEAGPLRRVRRPSRSARSRPAPTSSCWTPPAPGRRRP